MNSKIWPRRPWKWPLDLNDLVSGWVNFFKNYIFEISASSWEKWAIARPCGQNFHLICPQRRCAYTMRWNSLWKYQPPKKHEIHAVDVDSFKCPYLFTKVLLLFKLAVFDLMVSKGQLIQGGPWLISKANFKVFIWAKNPTKIFLYFLL